jgi:hypothetical protein
VSIPDEAWFLEKGDEDGLDDIRFELSESLKRRFHAECTDEGRSYEDVLRQFMESYVSGENGSAPILPRVGAVMLPAILRERLIETKETDNQHLDLEVADLMRTVLSGIAGWGAYSENTEPKDIPPAAVDFLGGEKYISKLLVWSKEEGGRRAPKVPLPNNKRVCNFCGDNRPFDGFSRLHTHASGLMICYGCAEEIQTKLFCERDDA